MEQAITPDAHPIYVRLLRALVVGILAVFLFYLNVMGAILKMGIRAIKAIPLGSKREVAKTE